MPLSTENIPQQIRELKKELQGQSPSPDFRARLECVAIALKAELAAMEAKEAEEAGSSIPQFDFSELDGFSAEQAQQIRRAGCCIVRNVLPANEVKEHNEALTRYIVDNGYYDQLKTNTVKDDYFSQLDSDKPQIFGIYWSPAQIWARQHPHMDGIRKHLNRLWDFSSCEDDNETKQSAATSYHYNNLAYADRIRRREPGDASLGLSPHVDSGSIERWLEPNYRRGVYQPLFGNNSTISWDNFTQFLEQYTPTAYRAEHRLLVEEIPSAAVCSVFRTFQGWVALTPQGAGDGTLQLLPTVAAMPYILLRALQDDTDNLCGAAPGRALTISPQHHPLLYDTNGKSRLVSIPQLQPGDTVWWHPDTVHAVEDQHQGQGYSNVLYIAAVPDCDKNRNFLSQQRKAFEKGWSCPDFAPEHYEEDYPGRPTVADLTPLGKQQMGFAE